MRCKIIPRLACPKRPTIIKLCIREQPFIIYGASFTVPASLKPLYSVSIIISRTPFVNITSPPFTGNPLTALSPLAVYFPHIPAMPRSVVTHILPELRPLFLSCCCQTSSIVGFLRIGTTTGRVRTYGRHMQAYRNSSAE